MRRAGMTLFEVGVSLLIVAIGITSVLLVFPVGIKAQQMARYKVYAATKVLELADVYAAAPQSQPSMDMEAPNPWDVPSSYRNMAPDLDTKLVAMQTGLFPLPMQLARRIDTDDDELARILDDGGLAYYANPHVLNGIRERNVLGQPASDSQRLVFAFAGYAQQNAIGILPWKAWPYHMPWPSPPMHGIGTTAADCAVDDARDADARQVFQATVDGISSGYYPYSGNNRMQRNAMPLVQDGAAAQRYVALALWYCAVKGLDATFWEPPAPLRDVQPNAVPASFQVNGMRFLAHAATCLTRHYDKATLDAGLAIPAMTIAGSATPSPATTITHDRIRILHESSLALAQATSARDPYDWGAPRMLNTVHMMHYPLLQWDPISAPLSGSITGTSPAVAAEQWRPIAAKPVTNPGVSFAYGATGFPNVWGDRRFFSLARPFTADERCRQMICWVVDWQSWEDAEIAPSAPVDASRYPKAAPSPPGGPYDWIVNPTAWNPIWTLPDFAAQMDVDYPGMSADPLVGFSRGIRFCDEQQYYSRNPEKAYAFSQDVAGLPTGTLVGGTMVSNSWTVPPLVLLNDIMPAGQPLGTVKDQGPTLAARQRFMGRFGADRNANKLLDRGPVPRDVRLRGEVVGRFNLYDMRVHATLR